MGYKLQVIVQGRLAETHELEEHSEYVVGRSPPCDILVDDKSVSRRHCSVKIVADGVEFTDLNSANGLYVGGVQKKRVIMRDGGEPVNIGMAQLRVVKASNHTGMIPVTGLIDGFPSEVDSQSEGSSGFGLWGKSPAPRGQGVASGAPSAPRPVEPVGHSMFGGPPSEAENPNMTRVGGTSDYRGLARERLAFLIDAAKGLAQTTEIEQLLNSILDHVFHFMKVKRAVVALTEDGELFFARAMRPQAESEDLSNVASQGILKRVFSSRQGVIIEDASLDRALKMNLSIVASNIKAAICVPILANQTCYGTIYADYPGFARLYTPEDLEFMTAFASIAALSIENHRMVARLRDDERLKRDLEIAEEIQKGLLPNESFNIPGLEIDWAYWPSYHVGGDFYDVIELDDGRVAVLIGDVSGKSIPAALYMARTLSFMRAIVRKVSDSEHPTDPGTALSRVNELLGESGERQVFATATMLLIEPMTGKILWSNAGHNPTLVWSPDDMSTIKLDADGFPLGVDSTFVYKTNEITVKPGTIISLYTDGLVEARNTAGKEFGIDNVTRILAAHVDHPVSSATKAMLKTVERHLALSPYRRDDVAIVNIRMLGRPATPTA